MDMAHCLFKGHFTPSVWCCWHWTTEVTFKLVSRLLSVAAISVGHAPFCFFTWYAVLLSLPYMPTLLIYWNFNTPPENLP